MWARTALMPVPICTEICVAEDTTGNLATTRLILVLEVERPIVGETDNTSGASKYSNETWACWLDN